LRQDARKAAFFIFSRNVEISRIRQGLKIFFCRYLIAPKLMSNWKSQFESTVSDGNGIGSSTNIEREG